MADDKMQGDGGDDTFILAVTSDATPPFSTITDFDVDGDMLAIVCLEDGDNNPDVRFAANAGNNVLRAFINRTPVAELEGLDGSDISRINYVTATLNAWSPCLPHFKQSPPYATALATILQHLRSC